ncbi:nucleolar protein 6 [Zerene cesonia]|uniref:nucleolar protein 6 n=1 Tax=Zerene cesonia TaxID=33412 RepID=UPI0018E5466D|nr:nucleolar protein 6 [Zerene cesonia]
MVEKEMKSSISEDDGETNIINENGKRPAEDAAKDGKKRVRTKNLYRQPTAKELNRLQETENLFNSNLFRLQIEEILQEVELKEKTIKRFNEWYNSLKQYLLSISENGTDYDLSEKAITKQLKVKLPISNELNKTKAMFKFLKFKDIDIVGSYASENAISSKLIVDLQITVPAETYTKNDSINYRYHKKRAAYLAYIASHLTKSDLIENIHYSWLNGGRTKPVLDINPKGKLNNVLTVRINLICEEEAYKLHRFSPGRNNLRESWLLNEENNAEVGPPTPYYNSSVLCDLTAKINEDFIKQTLANSHNLKQAIVLLKIWIRQRKLSVSGHVISMLICCLVQMKRINNIMSSYQIIRNVWIYLKTSDWDTKGLSLCKAEDSPPIDEFLEHFPVVFLDKTGYYNICWQMCKGTYNALRRESAMAVDMLDHPKINSFIPLFMTPVVPLTQFDHIIRFKNIQDLKTSILKVVPKQNKLNYGIDELPLVVETLYSLFSKGLTDRVDLILQLVDVDFTWSVKSTPEKAQDGFEEKLSFGLVLNSSNASRIVDKGPEANLPEAEQFRLFWGDKSELRRFQDGTHTEACVWRARSPAQRRAVCAQIVDYLMHLKYGIPSSEIYHICGQLDSMLARKESGGDHMEELAVKVLQTFDELRRDLRALTQLPLEISAVYGTSSVFSYCSPAPALPSVSDPRAWRRASTCLLKLPQDDKTPYIPPYTPANKAIVELTHSGKWPGDIDAFRCLKAAFHLQISERISQQYTLPSQAYPTHVDVMKNGLAFRLEIAHPKEVTLLRREMENGVVKFKESEESVRLQCETVLLPRLRSALHGLHTKHPAYGPAACLLKRWLSSHLLSPPHLPATLAELLAAIPFLLPSPLSPPTQPTTALYRTLRLLADTDWRSQMFLLDFNDDMTREEISEIERKFTESTTKPAMFIATSYDGELPSAWSTSNPSQQVVARVQGLAKATLQYVEKGVENGEENLLGAFIPSLAGYDALIRVHSGLAPLRSERADSRPRANVSASPAGAGASPAGAGASCDVVPVLDFHLVEEYLRDLRSAYDEFALFFHDHYGGDVIAVLWRPHVKEHRDFQIINANGVRPVKVSGETKYKVNIEAIIEDFRILGKGLVADIVVNS